MDNTKPPVLSPEEIAAAKKVAQEEVAKELKTKAKNELVEKFKKEARAEANPDTDGLREITLDLAGFADRMIIDGVIYFHGSTYTVPQRLYDTMVDMQSRTWDHQDSLQASDSYYRQPRRQVVTPKGVTTAAMLRA